MKKKKEQKDLSLCQALRGKKLILEKMKAKAIDEVSGFPNQKYDSEEIYELINIACCFSELRDKGN